MGCLSCVNSCTHQAIEFEKDVCGFRYPIIDQEKCVDCGLCGFVCPVNHPPEKYFPKECYAVTVKSERELFSCASGGAATAIARHVLNTYWQQQAPSNPNRGVWLFWYGYTSR